MTNNNKSIKPEYALIVGQGRSGTNWLLQLLDLSYNTYCRNESNELANSPLAQLPSPVIRQTLDEAFGQNWDAAVASASMRMGERDTIGAHPKFYLSEPVRRLGGAIVLNKPRVRRLLSPLMPSLTEPEWPIPWW